MLELITNMSKMEQRNYTYPSRYNQWYRFRKGITYNIQKYAERNHLETLKVVDVGCSTGVAIHKCAEKLRMKGIMVDKLGVDCAKEVKPNAEENVDRFIHGDVMKLTDAQYRILSNADVVILSRVLRYVENKSELKRRCGGFLKPGGILLINNAWRTIVKTWNQS